MSAALIAVVAAAGLAGGAAAEPLPRAGSGVGLVRTRHMLPSIPSSGPADGPAFSDGFDSYGAGSGIAGQGGWEIWYTGGGILARTPRFALESGRLPAGGCSAAASAPSCLILLGLVGSGVIRTAAGDAPSHRGTVVLLPAALAAGATVHAMGPAGFEWLAVTLTRGSV